MLSALTLLLAPALVAAHGAVTSYKIAGKEYVGYEVSEAMVPRFDLDVFAEMCNRDSLPSPARRSSSASGRTTTRS